MDGTGSLGDLRRPVMASAAAVVACFLIATSFAEYRTQLGGDPAVEIASSISPLIERLATLVVGLHDLESALDAQVESCADGRPCGSSDGLPSLAGEIGDSVRGYAADPTAHLAEVERATLLAAQGAVEARLDEVLRATHARTASVTSVAQLGPVRDAIDREEHALSRAIRGEARVAGMEASRISEARRRRMILVIVLDMVSVAMAIVLTWLALRAAVAQQRLQRARSEELENFTGRVAHDLMNPVTAAEISAVAALTGTRDDQRQIALERIARSLRRAREIAAALMEFARAGAQPRPGDRAAVRDAIDAIVADFSEEASAQRVEIVAAPVAPAQVACSGGVLASILGNLLRNALRYMGDRPLRRIYLRAERLDRVVRLEVEDSGPGLPSDVAGNAFEPFVRGSNASGPGVGLGLATVRRLVLAHRGTIGVSRGPRGGCLVWFALPLAVGASRQKGVRTPPEAAPNHAA